MEEKVNELLKEAFNLMGEDSDIVIIAHKDGKCASIIHGSVEINARSIFSFIHRPEDKVGQALYRILKLNVLNILGNNSPLSHDLIDSINDLAEKTSDNEGDEVQ